MRQRAMPSQPPSQQDSPSRETEAEATVSNAALAEALGEKDAAEETPMLAAASQGDCKTTGGSWWTEDFHDNERETHRGASIKLHFTPNAKTDSDQISLMQTVRVHKKTGETWAPNFGNSVVRGGRAVKDPASKGAAGTNLDRRDGYSSPFFGVDDADVVAAQNKEAEGTGQTFIESRLRSADGKSPTTENKAEDAWLWDSVWQTWSAGQQMEARFEVAAIARGGTDAGLVYGSVGWGFDVDSAGAIKRVDPYVIGKGNASETFHAAVKAWNDQADYEASTSARIGGEKREITGIQTSHEDWTLPSRDASADDALSKKQRAFEKRAG